MKKVNPKRKAAEMVRAYGSPVRREWIRARPCSVWGCTNRPSENAHVSPENEPSGMGRKGDYQYVIPLCRHHHEQYHRMGQRTFNDEHRMDVALVAVYTQGLWLEVEDVEKTG
jgi:hypothetical protein